ncbi:MAG TPA: phosphatidylserine/phosphatidylglycerophosphate/cardiolipin synthase family protein [Chlamydiales bacterium]|jgi:phosphatidylserine/phosphatidylglycerophosphate/cardiolipin synthase-like enzyme|nr:phosphatidylserine/phosphatidylglycerophosphate/cardiolipin synthase family protein [Chlamydiales bacterium]
MFSKKAAHFPSRRFIQSPSKSRPLASLKRRLFFPLCLFLVFCGCVWLIIESVSPSQPKSTDPPKFYSNQLQQDLRLTLVDAIRKAHQSIHLVMFGLSDTAILNALSHKTIPTTVYYDSNGSPNLWSALPNAELHPVRGCGLMHQKILICDRETIFIGSANMTTASLAMHDNLVIGFKSPKVAQFLIAKTPNSSGYLRTMVGGQDIEIWLLPDPRGHALQDLRKKIRSANESLKIALFTFTHPALVDEVIAAQNRGVRVTLLIDMHSAFGASTKAVERIKKAGVRILMSKGIQLLHHKFILIDDATLVTGSANWTKAAFYNNSDCILVIHQLNDDQKHFMNRMWSHLETEGRLLKTTAKSHSR